MAGTLPVLASVRGTYTFVWCQRRGLFALAFPAIVVLAIGYALLISALPESFATLLRETLVRLSPDASDAAPILALGAIALSLAQLGMGVVFAVACHRAFLVSEHELNLRRAVAWKRRHTLFLWRIIGVGFVVGLVQSIGLALAGTANPAAWSSVQSGLFFLVVIAALVVGYWVFARLALLFPAAALEHSLTFRQAFRLSRGNGGRLFAVLLLVVLPLWVLFLVWQPVGVFGILAGLTGSLLSALVDQVLVFAGIAIIVTALSLTYAELAPATTASGG